MQRAKRCLCMLLVLTLVIGVIPVLAAAQTQQENAGSASEIQPRAAEYTKYNEQEPNDAFEDAKWAFNGALMYGDLSTSQDRDLYRIELLSRGTVEIIAISQQPSLVAAIMDKDDNVYAMSQASQNEDGTYCYTVLDENGKVPLLQNGTYYIAIIGNQENLAYSFFYNWSLSRDHVHRYLFETVEPATCVTLGLERGICTCGETMNRAASVNPENHVNIVEIPEQAPTCTAAGLAGGTQCADCGTVVQEPEETGKAPHEYAEGVCIHCGTDNRESGDYLYKILEDGQTAVIVGYTGSAEVLEIPAELDGYRVITIGQSAFQNCESLTSVTVPEGVTAIEDQAFQGCTNAAEIILPGSLKTIGAKSFFYCAVLPSITIPDAVETIGQEAFAGCLALQAVDIGTGVKQIEEAAFQTWTMRLNTQITFHGNAPQIHSKAFRYLTATVYYPAADRSWKEDVMQNYGGILTWVPYGDPAPACTHSNTSLRDQKDSTCSQKGYTGDVYCDECDVVLTKGESIPLREHSYEKGICTVCGAKDENYVPETFSLVGVNMTLGNALDMNFFVNQADIEGDDNYAVITKQYADGREDKIVTLYQSQWNQLENLYYFTFSGVMAKEMGDAFSVVIYNAAGEAVSQVYTDSVQSYARRMLSKETTADQDKSLYVQMLNYGAAAQEKFRYDVGNLANSVITLTEQLRYAVGWRTYENLRQYDKGYVGTSLSLENRILFNVVFDPAYISEGAYVTATFVNHNGKRIEETTNHFEPLGKYQYVSFTQMSVADGRQLLNITLYDADGNAVVNVQDSMEGYVARMETSDPLYEAIMKFSDAAYQYFHN